MGKPSDKWRSARRPSRRRRARVKSRRKGSRHTYTVFRGGIVAELRAGPKKRREAMRSRNPRNPFGLNFDSHLVGDPAVDVYGNPESRVATLDGETTGAAVRPHSLSD